MIGFKSLRAVLADLHGEGASPGALLARFKYFQRMGFPGASNVGRGARAEYGLSDVLTLALAFELLETSATPVRIVRLLREAWPRIERALAGTWAALEGYGGQAALLAHVPGALGDLGSPDSVDAPVPDPLAVVEMAQLSDWLGTTAVAGAPSLYVIDLSRFVRRVAMSLVGVGEVDAEGLADQFRGMGADAFGTSDAARWRVAVDEGLPCGRDRD